MKTSEMMAMLEKNPKLRFRCNGPGGTVHFVTTSHEKYYKQEALFQGMVRTDEFDKPLPPGLRFFGNVAIDSEWELVPQSVPWQEALQAWAEGKTIKCEMIGASHAFILDPQKMESSQFGATTFDMAWLKKGTWYILEDGSID